MKLSTVSLLLHEFAVAHPHAIANRDGQIGEEVPPDIAARHTSTELGVVAERQADDAGSVSVIRNPRMAFGDGEQRIEAERELAKGFPRVPCLLHFRLHELAPGRGDDVDDLAFRE